MIVVFVRRSKLIFSSEACWSIIKSSSEFDNVEGVELESLLEAGRIVRIKPRLN